ncbi:MAG: hypothetical protein AAF849_14220 [Bacteroidota bacterium]
MKKVLSISYDLCKLLRALLMWQFCCFLCALLLTQSLFYLGYALCGLLFSFFIAFLQLKIEKRIHPNQKQKPPLEAHLITE